MYPMNCMYRTLLAAVALAVSGATASADTIFVPAGGDIIKAINQSSDGDVIQLEAGLYEPYATIDPFGRAITLRGVVDAGGHPLSVIDGSGEILVLRCDGFESSDAVFQNLLVRNGDAVNGGGMFIQSCSPTLVNCTFSENHAHRGGGIYSTNSQPTLISCVFTGNSALSLGGGMFNGSSSPVLLGCQFEGNHAVATSGMAGGMANVGGSSPALEDCLFLGNTAMRDGGGMTNESESRPVLTNCTFEGNSALGGNGGAIYHFSSGDSSLIGCDLKANTAAENGGGIFVQSNSDLTLRDCLLCGSAPNQIYGPWQNKGGNTIASECEPCPDADNDGICDEDDQCPGGDDTIDTDSDGTPDCLDGCPLDPLKTEPGRCGCGVVDTAVQGDFNCDGVFDIQDYQAMQAELGICPADLNLNGIVDGEDLGLLFSYWGTCVP